MLNESTLFAINEWMGHGGGLALAGAFLWGMVSVLLSPCHMASIPLLIAYVAGQKLIPPPRQAARFAVLFVFGIFLTIMVVGMACTVAGKMLGDVGPWWQAAVGIVLLWVAWTFFQPPRCSATGNLVARFQVQGGQGAFILGLAYGVLSGVCTFGFIAPILGLITMQREIMTGIAMLVFFGVGHCLPLVLCGMFSARVMGLLHSHAGLRMVPVMRKLAGVMIASLGVYFALTPFWD